MASQAPAPVLRRAAFSSRVTSLLSWNTTLALISASVNTWKDTDLCCSRHPYEGHHVLCHGIVFPEYPDSAWLQAGDCVMALCATGNLCMHESHGLLGHKEYRNAGVGDSQ